MAILVPSKPSGHGFSISNIISRFRSKQRSASKSANINVQQQLLQGTRPPLVQSPLPLVLPEHQHTLPKLGWTTITFPQPHEESLNVPASGDAPPSPGYHPLQSAYENLFAASQAFFHLPDDEKKQWKHKLGSEEGWSKIPGEKEFITLRSLEYCPDVLKGPAKMYWDLMGAHLSSTLARVEVSLDMPIDSLTRFVGPCGTMQDSDEKKTATMLRLFRYEGWEPKVVAEPHSDLGLLSVVVGNVPGLEVWDGHGWFEVEREVARAGMKGASLLVGRQLERLSNGRYGAGGHQVVSYGAPKPTDLNLASGQQHEWKPHYRFSIVFVLRAHEPMIINSDELETEVTGKWNQPLRDITAGKMYEQIRNRHYNINIDVAEREKQRTNIAGKKGTNSHYLHHYFVYHHDVQPTIHRDHLHYALTATLITYIIDPKLLFLPIIGLGLVAAGGLIIAPVAKINCYLDPAFFNIGWIREPEIEYREVIKTIESTKIVEVKKPIHLNCSKKAVIEAYHDIASSSQQLYQDAQMQTEGPQEPKYVDQETSISSSSDKSASTQTFTTQYADNDTQTDAPRLTKSRYVDQETFTSYIGSNSVSTQTKDIIVVSTTSKQEEEMRRSQVVRQQQIMRHGTRRLTAVPFRIMDEFGNETLKIDDFETDIERQSAIPTPLDFKKVSILDAEANTFPGTSSSATIAEFLTAYIQHKEDYPVFPVMPVSAPGSAATLPGFDPWKHSKSDYLAFHLLPNSRALEYTYNWIETVRPGIYFSEALAIEYNGTLECIHSGLWLIRTTTAAYLCQWIPDKSIWWCDEHGFGFCEEDPQSEHPFRIVYGDPRSADSTMIGPKRIESSYGPYYYEALKEHWRLSSEYAEQQAEKQRLENEEKERWRVQMNAQWQRREAGAKRMRKHQERVRAQQKVKKSQVDFATSQSRKQTRSTWQAHKTPEVLAEEQRVRDMIFEEEIASFGLG